MSSFDNRNSNWLFERRGQATFSSIIFCPFQHLFGMPGSVVLVQGGRRFIAYVRPISQVGLRLGRRLSHLRGQGDEQDARCRYLQPTFKDRAPVRRPNLDRDGFRQRGPECPRIHLPIRKVKGHRGHGARFAAHSKSSEVWLTPQHQLRQDLRDRLGSPRTRDLSTPLLAGVFSTAQSSLGRFCHFMSHAPGPPVKVGPTKSCQGRTATPTRQWDEANQPEAASIDGFQKHDSEESRPDARPCRLSHPQDRATTHSPLDAPEDAESG